MSNVKKTIDKIDFSDYSATGLRLLIEYSECNEECIEMSNVKKTIDKVAFSDYSATGLRLLIEYSE